MNLYEDLMYRGLIKDFSDPELKDKLNNEKLTFYIGTDPTADSMHIGHFSSFLIASRLAKYGHHPILLIGGATGLIGDPKPSKERPMISKEQVLKNVEGLTKQAKEIFGFDVVNNYDWSKEINFLDFFREYGKYINVNYMLDKDIIKRRLDEGITYCEFSYMLMQAMDFVHLYQNKGVTLQVAGSDQWGNITTGIELARKKLDVKLYGFTMPLILDSNGVKFGKTEGNALWLDETKTSSYELYQYLINTDDKMVIDYLKKLTFLTKKEIDNRLNQIIEFSELGELIDNPVRTYSSGQYMRLAFSVAINVDAEILLIDEILSVGDQHFQEKCFAKMDELKAEGKTMVFVTHSLGAARKLCDRAIWIYEGEVKMDGNTDEVIDEYIRVTR